MLARYAPAAVFKTVFVLIALLTAIRLIFRDRLPTLGQDVPERLRLPYGGYMAAGWDRMGLPPFSVKFVSIVAVLALMPTSLLTARLGARLAHHVSKRRLELCSASYLIMVGGQFGLSLALI